MWLHPAPHPHDRRLARARWTQRATTTGVVAGAAFPCRPHFLPGSPVGAPTVECEPRRGKGAPLAVCRDRAPAGGPGRLPGSAQGLCPMVTSGVLTYRPPFEGSGEAYDSSSR